MKAEQYSVRETEVAGWPVRIRTYRIGETWHAKADNVSPGATIARSRGSTLAEAEDSVLSKAWDRLSATRRVP